MLCEWAGQTKAERSVYASVTVIISWGNLSNEKLHNAYCSPNVILVGKINDVIETRGGGEEMHTDL
jgi:phosphopentomutase